MLHTQTVEANTYKLLKTLMADPIFKQFALAGGTALSLLIGHRKSIDLDMFTKEEFNPSILEQYLQEKYSFRGDFLEGFSLKGEVNGVKLDFIRHNYPDVKPKVLEDEVRLYGIEDISAMKLSAIADNGTRLKDFIDVAYLSHYLSLNEMVSAFEIKYPQTNPYRAIKGLNYHDDIRFAERIDLLGKDFKWEEISARLLAMTQDADKHFPHLGQVDKVESKIVPPKKKGRRM